MYRYFKATFYLYISFYLILASKDKILRYISPLARNHNPLVFHDFLIEPAFYQHILKNITIYVLQNITIKEYHQKI
jgi:hypothetical protein